MMGQVKKILVTGGASGIGAAICRRMSDRNSHFLVHTRANQAGLEKTIRDIERNGGRANAEFADLAVKGAARSLVQRAKELLGGLDIVVQTERKLTHANRDTLYDSNVNPIATFPGQGVTVFGQKTLQKKSSALDRINVRRLLIRVKKFIASSSRFLVFEQNTAATRRRFLGIVNPFLENVQSQSGLSAFRVVMDETNNTPDTIDRNQLIGQLFLQPTRTAEFIVLDFTIQPTGASFPE